MATYTWEATNSPVASSRTDDIWFFDESTGWLVNNNGDVSMTRDGGLTWQAKTFFDPALPGKPYLRCMSWASRKKGYFGAVTRIADADVKNPSQYLDVLLRYTDDGGESWKKPLYLPPQSPPGVCGIHAVNERVAYGSGTNDPSLRAPGIDYAGIIKTEDGGAHWSYIPLTKLASNLIDIYFKDEDTGWVVGGLIDPSCPKKAPPAYEGSEQYWPLKAVVLKTTNGGKDWRNTAKGIDGPCGEWGWKIQFINDRVGYVSLENMVEAAILRTTDGGDSWVRLPVDSADGKMINEDLEGIGFVDESTGWVGGWGKDFEGLFNSFTTDGGKTWVRQDHQADDPKSDPRMKINRYRLLGNPVTAGYCSGSRVYKLFIDKPEAAAGFRAAVAKQEAPTPERIFALTPETFEDSRAVEISYTLSRDAQDLYMGIWNKFAVNVRTLQPESPGRKVRSDFKTQGRHTVDWDGRDDAGKPVGPGTYFCKLSVDGRAESVIVKLP